MWIDTTIQIYDMINDIECEAEVEYDIDGGELASWRITDFRFPRYRTDRVDGAYKAVKTGTYGYCPDSLRPALLEFADKDQIETDLIDRLVMSGDLYAPSDADMAADYHARVL